MCRNYALGVGENLANVKYLLRIIYPLLLRAEKGESSLVTLIGATSENGPATLFIHYNYSVSPIYKNKRTPPLYFKLGKWAGISSRGSCEAYCSLATRSWG